MKKRFLLIITLLLLIFAIAVAPALAQGGSEKKKPTETPTLTPPPVPDIGELYGDLYVILREESGAPQMDPENHCIQPIASKDLTLYTQDTVDPDLYYTEITIATYEGGEISITIYPGEPFQLPTYLDTAGDLVECELSEEMAPFVQAVDFGRLNLGRAPDAVIDHALDEAISKMNAACAMELDPAGRIMLDLSEDCNAEVQEWFTIDAPAENLALYIKMMTDGHWLIPEGTITTGRGGDPEVVEYRPRLSPDAMRMIANLYDGVYSNLVCVTPEDVITDNFPTINQTVNDCITWDVNDLDVHDLQLAASLLAGAGDKFGVITLDMVVYINSIYGINQAADTESGVFNFGQYHYGDMGGRVGLYNGRTHIGTSCDPGEVYVLVPQNEEYTSFIADCVGITDAVLFNDYSEVYLTGWLEDENGNLYHLYSDYPVYADDVRGFAQAADDALQVLEYVHNYSVPDVMPTPEP